MTDLITKRITELSPAASMATGDLMVVRKTGESFDRKITKENIVESLGNPAVKGFVATYDGVNQITLTAVNGSPITAYKDKMVVSFQIPAGAYNPNANFTLRINDLAYKVVKQFSIDASIIGTTGKYIEAIFDNTTSTFYQTNDSNDANSSIEYTVGGTANAIALTTINGLTKSAYYDGMTISLVTKFATTNNVTIKVDNLVAKPLINQAGQPVNNLIINQPLFAIYNPTLNAFITQVNTFQVVTNEYNVASTIVTSNPNSTTFNLVSSVGLPKEQVFGGYYEGMTATFTVKFDELVRIRSTGTVFIKIDGFADAKVLTDPDNDPLANDVLFGQTIIARYDGTKFIKNRFAVEVDDGYPEEVIEPQLPVVEDPLDPNYQGDPRDPANTINENAVDDQGNRIFPSELVFEIGTGGRFANLTEAINQITRDYGINGERLNGKKIALVLINNAALNVINFGGANLSFITIFAKNNITITVNDFSCTLNRNTIAPIFNFKLNITNSTQYIFNGNTAYQAVTTLILGKNCTISTTNSLTTSSFIFNGLNVIAKYGLNVSSNKEGLIRLRGFSSVYINKGTFNFGASHTFETFIIDGNSSSVAPSVTIANSTINYSAPAARVEPTFVITTCNKVLFRNITNTTRQGSIPAISSYNSNVKLVSCNFASVSSLDIAVRGGSRLNYIRKNIATTGITNQPVNQETTLGTIIQEE